MKLKIRPDKASMMNRWLAELRDYGHADPNRFPGQRLLSARRWAHVPGIRDPLMINGVPVVTAPAEIDITTAEQLRVVLLRSAARGRPTIVVDMTRTRFCDSAGLTVLVRAHTQALADGGELRLVILGDDTLARIFASTNLDRLIPVFGSLEKALAPSPATVIRPLRPQPPVVRRLARQPGGPGRGCELMANNMPEISVAAWPVTLQEGAVPPVP